jgi:hypothetical protein
VFGSMRLIRVWLPSSVLEQQQPGSKVALLQQGSRLQSTRKCPNASLEPDRCCISFIWEGPIDCKTVFVATYHAHVIEHSLMS